MGTENESKIKKFLNQHQQGTVSLAKWLERMGEPDPLELATHFHHGQQRQRAVQFYLQAAERFLKRHDLTGLTRCANGALACGFGGGEALS